MSSRNLHTHTKKNLCLVAWNSLSLKSHTYWPSCLPLWSSFQSSLKSCLPGYSPQLGPNKTWLTISHIVHFFKLTDSNQQVRFKITFLALWTFGETEEGPSPLLGFTVPTQTQPLCPVLAQLCVCVGGRGTCKIVLSRTPVGNTTPASLPSTLLRPIFHLPLCVSSSSTPQPPRLVRGRWSTLFLFYGPDLSLHLTTLHTDFFWTLDPWPPSP